MSSLRKYQKYQTLAIFFVLCFAIAIIEPRFLTVSNITNVLNQTTINALIALGMTFVILTAGIDLSVGSILAFTGAIAATLIAADVSLGVTLFVAIAAGGLFGFINGVFIAKLHIQAFIATLAMMIILRGATYVFTGGIPISGMTDPFLWIGNAKVSFVPVPVLITIVIAAGAFYLLHKTRFGRYIYAVGGNEETARLSGINTSRVKILAYVISGVMSATAAIIVTSRIDSASPNAGTSFELDAIAAVVIGGTSLNGGHGRIVGTILGVLIIGVLNNALNLMGVPPFYQLIVKGSVILLAVVLDRKSR